MVEDGHWTLTVRAYQENLARDTGLFPSAIATGLLMPPTSVKDVLMDVTEQTSNTPDAHELIEDVFESSSKHRKCNAGFAVGLDERLEPSTSHISRRRSSIPMGTVVRLPHLRVAALKFASPPVEAEAEAHYALMNKRAHAIHRRSANPTPLQRHSPRLQERSRQKFILSTAVE